jgi:hypothetical protein
MSTSLIPVDLPPPETTFALTQAQTRLRQMVLDSVHSVHSKRNYAKALDDLFSFCASRPLSCAAHGISDRDGSPLSINY